MSKKRVQPSDFEATLLATVKQYADEVVDLLPSITEDAGKKCIEILKEKAPSKTGAYKKSFRKKMTTYSNCTICNVYSNMPSLPHLLENPHRIWIYGRDTGRYTQEHKHWKDAEKGATEYLEEQIKRKVEETS